MEKTGDESSGGTGVRNGGERGGRRATERERRREREREREVEKWKKEGERKREGRWKKNFALFRSQRFEKGGWGLKGGRGEREAVKSREGGCRKGLTNESHVVSFNCRTVRVKKERLDSRENEGSLSTESHSLRPYRSGGMKDFLNELELCSRFNGSCLTSSLFNDSARFLLRYG